MVALCVVPPFFPAGAVRNYRSVRWRKIKIIFKVHFRRRWAALRKAAALWTSEGEDIRQYTPKEGASLQPGML